MFRMMCKSKIQRARVTQTALHYEGSIGIDKKILQASNVYPGEMVQVLNLNNGARFETYAIEEKSGSGEIVFYGPAARMGEIGDIVIIIAKAIIDEETASSFKMQVTYLDKNNKIIKK